MYQWNFCRTCLSAQTLYPIFPTPEHNEKYTNIIFNTTGLKVEPDDTLPQVICTSCIAFINLSVKFRKKCAETHKQLLNMVDDKPFYEIKIEAQNSFKTENEGATEIDITEFLDNNDDFQDYDDHIPLDCLQLDHNYVEKTEDIQTDKQTDFEAKVSNLIEPIDVIFSTNKKKKIVNSAKEKTKRKVRAKKENRTEVKKKVKEKIDRARQEIECEYCHKVLTSKLSLRNHYKIHTGFDVVCEHCGKKFITRRLLLMHCRAKHGYEKTDKCSYCDYKASNAEQVKIHERLHTGEKPYVCKDCSAGFHRKSSYLQHIAIHLPEKTVQCDQCPARFKSITLMRIHKNRHRPKQFIFRCRVCENSFARRRNVVRHLQRIHGLEPDPQHIDRLKVG